MQTSTRAPAGRERGLMIMTGIALVTSLLLGGAAVGNWLMPGGVPRAAPAMGATVATAIPSPSPEPTPKTDAAACAVDPERSGPVGPPIVRWRFPTGSPISSAPAVVDNVLFVANWAGQIYAVDVRTGIERWRHALGSLVDETPVVGAGVVYVGTSSGAVHALDAATGQPRWRVTAAGHPATSPVLAGDVLLVVSGEQGAPPAVAGDTVFVGGGDDDQFVQSLDALTGAENWSVPLTKNGLYALDVATGAVRWHLGTKSGVSVAPVIAGEWVYVVDEALHKVDAASGGERWQVPVESASVVRAMAAEGTIFLAVDLPGQAIDGMGMGAEGWLYAFDEVTGSETWRFPSGGTASSTPVVAGDTVYIGGFDGNLYALDRDTGEERWRLAVGGRLATPVVACGVLYVGNDRGSLVAVANA